jgi:hypothetical protein
VGRERFIDGLALIVSRLGCELRSSRPPSGGVAYDELPASSRAAFEGPAPAAAYRRHVTTGFSEPPKSPRAAAHRAWILGSHAFIDRVAAMVRGKPRRERRLESRLLQVVTRSRVSEVVCIFHEIESSELSLRGIWHPAPLRENCS